MRSLPAFCAAGLLCLSAGVVQAQSTPPRSVIAAAQEVMKGYPMREVRVDSDSLVVVFEDSTLTPLGLLDPTWTFHPRNVLTTRKPKEVGGDVAKILWDGWAKDAGVRTITVEVCGAKSAKAGRFSMFYRLRDYSADAAVSGAARD